MVASTKAEEEEEAPFTALASLVVISAVASGVASVIMAVAWDISVAILTNIHTPITTLTILIIHIILATTITITPITSKWTMSLFWRLSPPEIAQSHYAAPSLYAWSHGAIIWHATFLALLTMLQVADIVTTNLALA